jgi:hypothetical protein
MRTRDIVRLVQPVAVGLAIGWFVPKYFGIRVFFVVFAAYFAWASVQIHRAGKRASQSLLELERAVADLRKSREALDIWGQDREPR